MKVSVIESVQKKKKLQAIQKVLRRQVPGRLCRIRRALRQRDIQNLEFELLKLSAQLPPLSPSKALLAVLPKERIPEEFEWQEAREILTQLERALEQLADELGKLLGET